MKHHVDNHHHTEAAELVSVLGVIQEKIQSSVFQDSRPSCTVSECQYSGALSEAVNTFKLPQNQETLYNTLVPKHIYLTII